jgi:hypothetical protein
VTRGARWQGYKIVIDVPPADEYAKESEQVREHRGCEPSK